MGRSRRYRCFTEAELTRFLDRLATTGNMTLAAEAIGRPVRSLRDRRRRDPDFATRCDLALAAFRTNPAAAESSRPAARKQLRTAGGEWVVVRGGPHGAAQRRRAKAGQLTEAGFTLFLRTLEATANIDLSARSVGVSSSTIDYHRSRDVAFDQQVTEALKEGVQRLEAELLASALRGLNVAPAHEEDETAAEPGWPTPPPLPPMTASEALAFLAKQQELLSRPRRWSPERDRQINELALARLEKALKRYAPGLEKG